MAETKTAPELIDQLIKQMIKRLRLSYERITKEWDAKSWDNHLKSYIKEHIPALMSDISKGNDKEKEAMQGLQKLLNKNEWDNLPDLVEKRRKGESLIELESEQIHLKQVVEPKAAEQKRQKERAEAERKRQADIKRQKEEREAAEQKQLVELERQAEIDRQKKILLLKKLHQSFNDNFIGTKEFYDRECSEFIEPEEFEQEKISFVKSWLKENLPDKNAHALDDEQIAAIAAVNGNVQVTARAGSGKTTVLVYRAFFLIKHCRVCPNQMLLLAFNKKAAVEIQKRLLLLFYPEAEAEMIQKIEENKRHNPKNKDYEQEAIDKLASKYEINYVRTFHSFALSIVVNPKGNIIHEDELKRFIQDIIDDHISIPKNEKQIKKLMLAYFAEDWDKVISNFFERNKELSLDIRRSLRTESLNGERLKSHGEKVIANFLFEHDIVYKYEPNFDWWDRTPYRPDFRIFNKPPNKGGIIIEYFGMKEDADYDKKIKEKIRYWEHKKKWELIALYPQDVKRGAYQEKLKSTLEKHSIKCIKLSEEEIWQKLKDRKAIYKFTGAITSFINRCRKESLSPDDLREHIDEHIPISDVEKMFLKIGHILYEAYLARLDETNKEDFDGLMQRAVKKINTGCNSFRKKGSNGDNIKAGISSLRYIFIDEFQDFSKLFYLLLEAVSNSNPAIELFCVGDDWQAINGFAGSELEFFENFEEYFVEAQKINISTNYRSHRNIVLAGNALMKGRSPTDVPAKSHEQKPGRVLLADMDDFVQSSAENILYGNDAKITAMRRVVNQVQNNKNNIVFLCRKNKSCQNIAKKLGKGIYTSTTHHYKGMEKPVVIIPDATDGEYPIIHPYWVFSRIFGDDMDKIVSEERRLFYVAMTRAIETLIIFTESERKSPFLQDIQGCAAVRDINWREFPPIKNSTNSCTVEIGNQPGRRADPTMSIMDKLMDEKYKWNQRRRVWAKLCPRGKFSPKMLKSESWAREADGVDVKVLDGSESIIAHYHVNGNKWHKPK